MTHERQECKLWC